jgi:hypothetical protein
MQDPFVKSAVRGLILGHVALALAGGAAVVLFGLLAFTQFYWLVVIVPVVALALVTIGTLALLRHDDAARKKSGQ